MCFMLFVHVVVLSSSLFTLLFQSQPNLTCSCCHTADDRIAMPPGFWTQYQPILNEFYNIIQPMSARVPFMTTVG